MSPFDSAFWNMAAVSGTISFSTMFFFWLRQLKTRDAGSVDLGWTLGLMTAAAVSFVLGAGSLERKAILLSMGLLASGRLALLLTSRLRRGRAEDPRYQSIRADWGKSADFNFFFFFEFQAALTVLLALPFFISAQNTAPLSLFEAVGFLFWLIGFLGESLADGQLSAFKKIPANKGKPCEAGLWKFSRHPNYFFEWIIWVGYFIFACGSPWGWVSIICPLLILHFLVNVSGIPPAEAQALKTKGELYRDYQKRTSAFIPRRPKAL